MSGKGGGGGRKNNIRKRKANSSDEDEEGVEGEAPAKVAAPVAPPAAVSAAAGAIKPQVGAKKVSKKSTMSFGGEDGEGEEEEDFVIKKKKNSKATAAAAVAYMGGKDREKEKASAVSSYYSSGSYTDADMAALSKNAKSIGGRELLAPGGEGGGGFAGAGGTDDGGKKLKKKERSDEGKDAPVKIKGMSWAPKNDDDDGDDDEDREASAGPRVRIVENQQAAVRLKEAMNMMGGGADAGDAPGLIPTHNDIQKMKARRELARQHGPGEGRLAREFIPLEEGGQCKYSAQSRLSVDEFAEEEDDIVGEQSNERSRMTFGKGGDESKLRRAEISAHLAASGDQEMGGTSSGDEEEHSRQWEEDQLRKGEGGGRWGHGERRSQETLGETKVAASATQIKTMEEVQKTLKGHLSRMRAQNEEIVGHLQEANAKVTACMGRRDAIEREIKEVGGRYTFFQETRSFLEDLLSLLDNKAPLIEDLEDELHQARRARSLAVRKRRQANVSDEVADARERISKATGRALPRISGEVAELDEFGRDPSFARGRRMKEHAERRGKMVERKRKGGWTGGVGIQGNEEMWTTDESDGEVEQWGKARADCARRADDVWEDVKEEFRQVPQVIKRFTDWRRRHSKAYRDAWASLSIPRVLSPYVRWQILGWDPLEDGQAVEGMPWVGHVFSEDAEGEEDELIPRLVEQVVVPKVKEVIADGWDPTSSSSTGRCVGMLQDVVVYVLDVAPNAIVFLQNAVVAALGEEFERQYPGLELGSKAYEAAGGPGLEVAKRCFLRCCKLVTNAVSFREVLSPAALQELTMENVTCKRLLPFLYEVRVVSPPDASELAEALLRCFPDEWLRSPKIEKLVNFARRG